MIYGSFRRLGTVSQLIQGSRFCSHANHFTAPRGPIQKGYGEYIFAHIPSPESAEPISLSEHHSIYDLTEEVRRDSGNFSDLKAAVQSKLGPSVFPVFVPRTVYELIFLEKGILEDLSYNDARSATDIKTYWNEKEKNYNQYYLENIDSEENPDYKKIRDMGFWKLCHYSNLGNQTNLPGLKLRENHLKEVSFEMNREIVNRFMKEHGGLSKEGALFTAVPAEKNLRT